jgi:hypothetical protein
MREWQLDAAILSGDRAASSLESRERYEQWFEDRKGVQLVLHLK